MEEKALVSPEIEPRHSVCAILVVDDGVMTSRRKNPPDHGLIELPGGKIEEFDADLKGALMRELSEELPHIEFEDSTIPCFKIESTDVSGIHWNTTVFIIDATFGEYEGPESEDFIYLDRQSFYQLDEDDFAFYHWKLLNDFFEQVGN